MSQRTLPLKTLLLGCALLAMPLSATEPPQNLSQKVQVSPSLRLDPNDPLHQWFKEQDKVLDEILVRLARIEQLVRDLHRLISQLPGGTSTAPAVSPQPPAASDKPAPLPKLEVPVPSAPLPRAKPSGIWGFFDEWGVELASIGMLILVALMSLRNRREKQQNPKSSPPADKAERPSGQPRAVSTQPSEPAIAAPPVSIDQNDQALELAEIMLTMGLGHGAAQTLIEQISREPRQALLHWLKLLEIYRKNGQQAEFEHAAEELRKHFNMQPEAWNAKPGTKRGIEDYPHIAARVSELWGTPAGLTYLQNLLGDNRGGARAGFPQTVVEEFVLLVSILQEIGVTT